MSLPVQRFPLSEGAEAVVDFSGFGVAKASHDERFRAKGRWLIGLFLLAAALAGSAADAETYAERIAPLIDPAKLATLGERGANPRVQEYVAQLADARRAGIEVSNVVNRAVTLGRMKGEGAKLTAEAMLRNLTIAERLGCLDKAGLRDMRRGQSRSQPTPGGNLKSQPMPKT